MKASSQHHAAEALFPGQNPFTHEIGEYVGPTEAVWDILRTRDLPSQVWNPAPRSPSQIATRSWIMHILSLIPMI
jgi:hypothetical protein